MEHIEENKMFVELAIARHAYLAHFGRWIQKTLRDIDAANQNNIDLPDFMTPRYVEALRAKQEEVEQQIWRDGQAVLKMAKKEVLP